MGNLEQKYYFDEEEREIVCVYNNGEILNVKLIDGKAYFVFNEWFNFSFLKATQELKERKFKKLKSKVFNELKSYNLILKNNDRYFILSNSICCDYFNKFFIDAKKKEWLRKVYRFLKLVEEGMDKIEKEMAGCNTDLYYIGDEIVQTASCSPSWGFSIENKDGKLVFEFHARDLEIQKMMNKYICKNLFLYGFGNDCTFCVKELVKEK